MSPARMAKIEASTRSALKFAEAFNRHDVPSILKLLSDDCVFETPNYHHTPYSGKEAITTFWQNFFRESPQASLEIEEVFGFGERCVMRWKCSWVNPTGENQQTRGVDIFRVRSGFIRESVSYTTGFYGRNY